MAIAIIGVGNILMMDEGVGVRIIEELKKRKVPKGIDLFDAGTAIMDLLPNLDDYRMLIIVDAVKGGNPPGSVYKFRPEDVQPNVGRVPACLHHLSLLDALAVERLASGCKHDVTIIGIEPDKIEVGFELSPLLQEKISKLADRVLEEALADSGL